jgi:hypothetical protein
VWRPIRARSTILTSWPTHGAAEPIAAQAGRWPDVRSVVGTARADHPPGMGAGMIVAAMVVPSRR